MLAKAYLQRTRLNEPEAKEWAKLALETAESLINNASTHGIALWVRSTSLLLRPLCATTTTRLRL